MWKEYAELGYVLFTFLGILCYWLKAVDAAKENAKKFGRAFFALHFIQDNFIKLLINTILIIVGNIISIAYMDEKKLSPIFIWAAAFTLAWGGGSMMRYALDKAEKFIRKYIDKFFSK